MIVRVAVGVLRTGSAEDTRSDDEEEEEVESHTNANGGTVVHGGVVSGKDVSSVGGVGDSSSAERRRSNGSPSVRTSRGRVRLGDQNDRKALLGRIGCEKPVS